MSTVTPLRFELLPLRLWVIVPEIDPVAASIKS